MRESTEVETQQLADCEILPSNTSYILVNKTQEGTGMESAPGQPRASKALKAPQPPPCSPAGLPTLCLSRGAQCFVPWIKLAEQSCKSRICWEVNPEDIWESHLEVAAHKLCCTRDFSRAFPCCAHSWEGQMETPVTQPMLKSL